MSEFLAESVVDGQRVINTRNVEGNVQTYSQALSEVVVEVSDGVYQRCIAVNDVGGGGGTSDYANLENKPQINSVTLAGDKTASDLGLQDALVSGTNIKTINNTSILGNGNIDVSAEPVYNSSTKTLEF